MDVPEIKISGPKVLQNAFKALKSLSRSGSENPMALEIKFDSLASALTRIPYLRKSLEGDVPASLADIIDSLVSAKKLPDEALELLAEIQSILEKLDYDGLDNDEKGSFTEQLDDFCYHIEQLLNKIDDK